MPLRVEPRNETIQRDAPVRVLIGNDHLGYGEALHGVGRYLLNITTRFARDRVRPVLVILRPEPKLERLFTERDVKVHSLGRSKWDPRALTDLTRIVRQERIEIIHVQGLKADTLGRIAGLRTGVPTILHGRDRIADRPLVMRLLDRVLGPHTSRALAVSRTVRRYLNEERHIPLDRIDVFYHGVDLSVFDGVRPEERERVRTELGIPAGAVAAGTTSRLHPSKGHFHLLRGTVRVVERFPDFRLVIANEGSEAEPLRDEARKLGLEGKVLFTGSRDDIRALLSALDVFVMPSLSEGFPNAMLEGMAMGRPVVATNVDGMGEMLAHEQNALVVPPADAEAMGEALLRATGDPALRERLAEASRRFAEELSIDRTVERLTDIYASVARRAAT